MLEKKASFEDRELAKSPMSEAELDALIGKRDYLEFLNTRNELYREWGWKDEPPTRKEALKRMAGEVNLIKRPLLIKGTEIVFGFDEKEFERLLR